MSGVDADLIPGFANAALNDISDAERVPYLLYVHRLCLKSEARIPGDHEQAGDFGKVGDDVVGNAV